MSGCEHHEFAVSARVARVTGEDGGPVTYFSLELNVECVDCGEAFEFQGAPCGYSPYRPMCSLDGRELCAPIMPAGQTVPEGLPGTVVRVTGGEAAH